MPHAQKLSLATAFDKQFRPAVSGSMGDEGGPR
jgi:hypothetical protein